MLQNTRLPQQITPIPGLLLLDNQLYRVGITKHGWFGSETEREDVGLVVELPCGKTVFGSHARLVRELNLPFHILREAALRGGSDLVVVAKRKFDYFALERLGRFR